MERALRNKRLSKEERGIGETHLKHLAAHIESGQGAFRGLTLHVDPRSALQVICGLYERETYGYLQKLTTGIESAVDIGASQGEFTIFLLKVVGAKTVLAFEPDSEHRDTFQANLKENGLDGDKRLQVVRKYLGQRENNEWTTLNSFANVLREPVFIKMDVDGGEVDLLLGGGELLNLARVRLLIETHSAELEKQCIKILENHGFTTKIIDNAWWRYFIKDQRPIGHNRWLVGYRRGDQL